MPNNGIAKALKRFKNYLITSHVNPEPDALGSELAVYELLKKLGKKASVVNSEPVSEHYRFMEGVDIIKQRPDKNARFDAAVVVDCPNLKRTGKVNAFLKDIKYIINIDHHISNENFGNVNVVKPDASSAAEIVYEIYRKRNIRISKKVALYIYMAILTDTGSFNYSNTSGVTHAVVSELLGYGIKPDSVSSLVYENKKFADLKLLGEVLSSLTLVLNNKVAYMVCTNEMIRKTGSSVTATENFVNFARSVRGVKVAVLFREEPGKKGLFKISLRSKGAVSVNKIALYFEGGGHKHAAGCVVAGSFPEVKKKLLEKIRGAV